MTSEIVTFYGNMKHFLASKIGINGRNSPILCDLIVFAPPRLGN